MTRRRTTEDPVALVVAIIAAGTLGGFSSSTSILRCVVVL
jgi:hypothetical protein